MRRWIILALFLSVWIITAIFGYQSFSSVYSYRTLGESGKKLIFFSENAFYYSFYDDLVSGKSLKSLTSTDAFEYPDRVDALTKYKIAPEAILASVYPLAKNTGIVPMDFYLYGVYALMGLAFALVFILSYSLTGSLLLSFSPFLFLVTSLPYSTRAIVFPSLRENFAVPFWLLSVYLIQKSLDEKKLSKMTTALFLFSLIMQTLFWQFSVYNLLFLTFGIVAIYLLTRRPVAKKLFIYTALVMAAGYLMNSMNKGSGQHVLNFVLFRLSAIKPDFHTMNYWCDGVFRGLGQNTLLPLTKNLLIPFAVLGGVLAVKNRKYPMVVFGIAYLLVSLISERFLVLAIPLWSAIAGYAFSLKVDRDNDKTATIGLILLLGFSILTFSYDNTKSYLGAKYGTNPNQASLMTWIKDKTGKGAVFAAPSDVTAQIKLSTDRKITINPFYEDERSREKNLKYFQLYNNISEKDYHKLMVEEKANYVISEYNWCYGSIGMCSAQDIFRYEKKDKSASTLCRTINSDSKYFKKTYSNSQYTVYEVLRQR